VSPSTQPQQGARATSSPRLAATRRGPPAAPAGARRQPRSRAAATGRDGSVGVIDVFSLNSLCPPQKWCEHRVGGGGGGQPLAEVGVLSTRGSGGANRKNYCTGCARSRRPLLPPWPHLSAVVTADSALCAEGLAWLRASRQPPHSGCAPERHPGRPSCGSTIDNRINSTAGRRCTSKAAWSVGRSIIISALQQRSAAPGGNGPLGPNPAGTAIWPPPPPSQQ
jgi:hypothetical protein